MQLDVRQDTVLCLMQMSSETKTKEEFIGGIPYRKQNYMFDYFGNIRKCYEKKLSDPFFNPISQKRERDYWKNNKKWRIE